MFAVYSTDDLGQPLSPVPMLPMNLGNGQFEATIPAPGTAAHFYVVTLALP
ncbi:MAG TPA: hypothetical protein VNT99_16820 [Methylomirabilota bacterium]|nr:hypothetical protein [Methylomirabilota bacterium]